VPRNRLDELCAGAYRGQRYRINCSKLAMVYDRLGCSPMNPTKMPVVFRINSITSEETCTVSTLRIVVIFIISNRKKGDETDFINGTLSTSGPIAPVEPRIQISNQLHFILDSSEFKFSRVVMLLLLFQQTCSDFQKRIAYPVRDCSERSFYQTILLCRRLYRP